MDFLPSGRNRATSARGEFTILLRLDRDGEGTLTYTSNRDRRAFRIPAELGRTHWHEPMVRLQIPRELTWVGHEAPPDHDLAALKQHLESALRTLGYQVSISDS